jgi:hypothetical protein
VLGLIGEMPKALMFWTETGECWLAEPRDLQKPSGPCRILSAPMKA